MCLRFQFTNNTYPLHGLYPEYARTNKAWKATPPKRKTGYKVFTKVDNEIKSFYFGFQYEKDVWYTATNNIVKDAYNEEYKTGFHIFRTRKCAKFYSSPFIYNILIAKVEYDEILTTGCELVSAVQTCYGFRYIIAPVIVANKMRIIGEV